MSELKPQPRSRNAGVNLLVYGVPGSGKTRLAASGSRTLIIRPPTDHTDSADPEADFQEMVVDDHSGLLEAFIYLQQGGHREFDWVWLDSISLMQDHLLDDVMADAIARKPTRAVEKGGIQVPEFGPDQGEYKINFDRIAKWVRQMVGEAKAGHFNFGITAHPFEWYDPTKEEDVWAPWIQGKQMSPKICGYMNIVAYLQEVEVEDGPNRSVLLTEAPGFVGKDQDYAFPTLKSGRRGIGDPTIKKIEDVVKKARGGSRPKKTTTTKRRTRARRK